MKAGSYFWSDDNTARLCELKAKGMPSGAIAAELGISRNAVMGRLHRLRAAGDPRVPEAEPSPAAAKKIPDDRWGPTLADRLAELMAQRSPTFGAAAYRLNVSKREVEAAWQTILDRLGSQAA